MIYTHDEATAIIELFASFIERYNISVPSQEMYSEVFDAVEERLCHLLARYRSGERIATSTFRGSC